MLETIYLFLIIYFSIALAFWGVDAFITGLTADENTDYKLFQDFHMWIFWPLFLLFLIGLGINILLKMKVKT